MVVRFWAISTLYDRQETARNRRPRAAIWSKMRASNSQFPSNRFGWLKERAMIRGCWSMLAVGGHS